MKTEPQDFLLYDGHCPVCTRYVAWTRLRELRPDILLADARKEPELVAWVRAKGIEINDSFCLYLDGQLLHGADAMTLLGQLSRPSGLAAKMLIKLMSSSIISRPLYPILASMRKLLLVLLRRGLIR